MTVDDLLVFEKKLIEERYQELRAMHELRLIAWRKHYVAKCGERVFLTMEKSILKHQLDFGVRSEWFA